MASTNYRRINYADVNYADVRQGSKVVSVVKAGPPDATSPVWVTRMRSGVQGDHVSSAYM
jgi:hypothetical protein